MALMPVDEALTQLISAATSYRLARPCESERLALLDALHRLLAEDVRAPIDVPPNANSAMDGYAFRWADAGSAAALPVSQRIPAGRAPTPLLQGTAARIFTGGVIPEGADTVEMQENCCENHGQVSFLQQPKLGGNIRQAGEDLTKGSIVLRAGTRLEAAELGLLASLGLPDVPVYRRLRVALLCSGDELVAPGGTLRIGQLFNSNETLLIALLLQQGCDVLRLPPVADTLVATEQALRDAVSQGAELIISTGGVSVGEEDHLRAAMQRLGRIDLWKIAIKPGKPLAFGEVQQVPMLGLPGNPQSVWVTSHVLALPFIRCLQGDTSLALMIKVPAGFERTKSQNRREYLRVRVELDEQGVQLLVPHAHQGSGVLSSASWADGFAVVEAGTTVALGQLLPFFPVK